MKQQASATPASTFSTNLNAQPQTQPPFVVRLLLYFSLGILWVLTLFGVLFLAVIMKIGSRHSYVGDVIDEQVWAVLISAMGSYTIGMSVYLGIRGYQARFNILLIMNLALILAFTLSVVIQTIVVFYAPS